MTRFRATVEIPASAIDAAVNDRIRELERDRDDARLVAESHRIERDGAQARVKDLESDVCKLSQELHVARADLAAGRAVRDVRDEYLEELNETRHLLGAGPGVTALEAVKQAQKEIAEARSEANRCFAEHESMRRARDAAKRDLSAAVDTIGAIGEALSCGLGEAVLDAAARVARERDEAKARVYALTTERDEEKARRLEAERELELARVEAEAKPSQAACRLRKERDEAKALAQTEVTRASRLAIDVNTLRRHLDEARAALVQTRRDFSAAAEMRDKWSTRVAELETAIRTLGKVLQ